jgi:hypothetical protein
MILFDPEVGPRIKGGNVAGRQGGGREIMRENECNSKTIKKECHIAPGVKPEKGHLAQG